MKLQIPLLVSALCVLAGCDWFNQKKQEAQKPTVRVVNVLSKELYDDAHIKGSINVDFMELEKTAAQWDKTTPIVFYCSNYSCSASGMAVQMLRKLGFTNVKAYEGGMAEWYQLHKKDPAYEIEGPAQQQYLSTVVPQPKSHGDVEVITAAQLKDLLATKTQACTNPMGCCPDTH